VAKAAWSAIVSVSVGFVETGAKAIAFIPSEFEKQVLKTDTIDKSIDAVFEGLDEIYLNNPDYIDAEAYKNTHWGGSAIFTVVSAYELTKSVPSLINSVKNIGAKLPSLFETIPTLSGFGGGAATLSPAIATSITIADVRALATAATTTAFFASAYYVGMNESKDARSEFDSSGSKRSTNRRGTEAKQKNGTPGNNQAQNKQVNDVVKKLGLDKDERRMLHNAIGGENFSYKEILEEGLYILNERGV